MNRSNYSIIVGVVMFILAAGLSDRLELVGLEFCRPILLHVDAGRQSVLCLDGLRRPAG
jgi:hypothetical protein